MNIMKLLKAGDYMKIITRTKYLDRIIELNGTPDIKIITGIRRSGKSKLMQAYIEYLKSHFENINIIFIDFMDLAYEEIKEYVIEVQKASASLLQRRFGIGYNRAARMIDVLEDKGIIGPQQGSKPREVYAKKDN